MTESVEHLKQLLDNCSDAEVADLIDYLKTRVPQHLLEKDWGVNAEIILSAISRSSDLTKRGVRGIIAEAVFERNILPTVQPWKAIHFIDDRPYDFLICLDAPLAREVRIQVKLQRMRKQQPMLASDANRHYPKDMYVVEVQKTRGGIDFKTKEDTRPYRFGEFDILAVNMHPSSRDWNRFLYTLSDWLVPRSPDATLIEIFQPVARVPNDLWTDNLEVCIEWLTRGEKRRIFDIDPGLLQRRKRRSESSK